MVRWVITEAKALPGSRLALRFADGLQGSVELQPEELTGALARLRETQYFERMRLVDGVPSWPDGEDLAPDRLYEDVRRAVS